ncbi:hypothetical protein [Thalassolituus hydrocarboniclasticus]|uniref:Integrase n=1 Tax=Thalassolituus hydrocarboniclasticus TaxID=2742796 RepID=A0ABY6AD29_9GAMM|nr:hypothetical protein [Thalassolituus hydrocarboniclasticus]UXD88951.1 hypothetical protein HUF19_16550 [Thalassolituus hydrocarboniclasticus]
MGQIVREILNPPLGETGLHQVRENLGRLVNETRWQIPPVVTDLLADLDHMASEEKRGADWSVKYSVPASSRLHGTLVDNPVWAALYADNRHSILVRQLQSLLLEALDDSHAVLLPHDVAAAGLLIRVLSLGTGEDDQYYDDLLEAVAQCPATASQKTNAGRFIRAALGQRVTRRERGSVGDVIRVSDGRTGTRHDHYGEVHVLVPADPDDPADLPEVSEFVAHKKFTSGGARGVSQTGIDPGEDQPGDQVLLLIEAVRASSIEHKIARRQSRTARDILARANAALPITYQQLTDAELHVLADYIANRNYSGGTDKQCVQMAISIMLYTCSSLDDVLNMAEDTEGSGLKFDWIKNQFRIPRITPNYATRDTGAKNSITSSPISDDDYVIIPNLYIRPGSIEAFRKELRVKERGEFSAYIKKELKSLSDRITVHKIQRCAFEIARTHYDPVIVQTTFGLRISSANVQQYYSAVSDVQVIHCYTMATREMRRRMGMVVSNETPDTLMSANGFYSARNMPTDACVKNMILQLSMDALSSNRGSQKWHNANTLLCIMVQALLTTIRGVYDPFIPVEHSEHALFFRDKDRPDYSHSRFQFVHPLSELVTIHYQSVRNLTVSLNKIADVSSHIFFLDEDNETLVSPHPKHIVRFMAQYWHYPVNSLRKFVRRKLVEYGVSYEATNMMMNHHSVGESSWDPYSTDDPAEMREEIMALYDRLIKELSIYPEWFNAV